MEGIKNLIKDYLLIL